MASTAGQRTRKRGEEAEAATKPAQGSPGGRRGPRLGGARQAAQHAR